MQKKLATGDTCETEDASAEKEQARRFGRYAWRDPQDGGTGHFEVEGKAWSKSVKRITRAHGDVVELAATVDGERLPPSIRG
jgi:hypothetical protein